MRAQHDALVFGMRGGHRAQLEAEIEAGALPRQEAELAAKHRLGQRLGVRAGGDGDDRVGVDMVDVGMRHEGMQGGVDRGGARIEREGAMVEQRDHRVFLVEAAIVALQALQLVEIERREAVAPHRADVAARAFDPEHLDHLAVERVGHGDLGRGVAAAKIGDAQVAAEQVGAVEQQVGLVERRRMRAVPEIWHGWRYVAHRRRAPLRFHPRPDLKRHSLKVNHICEILRRNMIDAARY